MPPTFCRARRDQGFGDGFRFSTPPFRGDEWPGAGFAMMSCTGITSDTAVAFGSNGSSLVKGDGEGGEVGRGMRLGRGGVSQLSQSTAKQDDSPEGEKVMPIGVVEESTIDVSAVDGAGLPLILRGESAE